MKTLFHSIGLATATCLGAANLVSASDSCSLQVPFLNLGIDTNATATLNAQFGAASAQLVVKAAHLTPGQSYTLKVWEISEFTTNADSKGRWSATFRTPARKGSQPLDFDPRGQTVSLLEGTNVLLQARVSKTGEPAGSKISEKAELHSESSRGLVTLSFQELQNGRRLFNVKLSGVTGTNWSLYVNGINRGPISARRGLGLASYDSAPGTSSRRLLDFDPRGLVVDIAQSNNLVFSGECAAQIKRVNHDSPSLDSTLIPSTGLDSDGLATARLRVDKKARRKFSVEVEDVPAGSYELLADGVFQGNLNVTSLSGATRGEIEFTSGEDDPSELPLTFEPTNAVFTIQSGGNIYFQGAATFASGTGTNEPPTLIDESLASTGLDADASGDAKYEIDDRGRRKFSVEIEDVPVGSYNLLIGGVKRGALSVQNKSGKIKGQLEFSTSHDPGELPLAFDPRGELLEVSNASGVYFSNLFGTGGTNGALVAPIRFKLPLFNIGTVASATADVDYKCNESGKRSFQVEVEDLPVGAYDLLVGGVNRATITVVSDGSGGTRGQIEFSDEPASGELSLDFDPLLQEIVIAQNGVSFFARILPDGN